MPYETMITTSEAKELTGWKSNAVSDRLRARGIKPAGRIKSRGRGGFTWLWYRRDIESLPPVGPYKKSQDTKPEVAGRSTTTKVMPEHLENVLVPGKFIITIERVCEKEDA